jgi:DnaJ-domain-containing protein 1
MRDDLNVRWASGNQQQQQQPAASQRERTKRSCGACCMRSTIRHDFDRASVRPFTPVPVEKISVSFKLA